MPRFNKCIYIIISCFFMYTSVLVQALPDDRDQEITIESDEAEFREADGVTLYTGNVRMQQGSILLTADNITIYTEDNKIARLVARGNLAQYEQQPELNGEKIYAKAKIIEYLLLQDVINLKQQATLTQQGASLAGSLIVYDVRKHVLTANRAKSTNKTPNKERVRVTLPPLSQQNQKRDAE